LLIDWYLLLGMEKRKKKKERSNYLLLQIATPSPGFLYNGAIFPVEKNGELQVAAVTPYHRVYL
jgi:hypothetical protein